MPFLRYFLIALSVTALTFALSSHPERRPVVVGTDPGVAMFAPLPDTLDYGDPSVPTTTTTTTTELPRAVPPAPRRVVADHSDEWWFAIARCETGTDWSMHGSVYSSAFGIVNAGVRQYAPTPEAAERILAGVGTPGEQLATARALWADAGDRAWGCSPVAWSIVPGG